MAALLTPAALPAALLSLSIVALVLLLGRALRARRRRVAELRDRIAVAEGVLASLGDAVVIADRDGRVAFANDVARRHLPCRQGNALDLFGTRPPVLFRADGITPIPPEDSPLVLALRGSTTQEAECLYRPPGAEPTWFSVSARPLADARGESAGAVSVLRDVTRAKRASLALQHANARLQTSVGELRRRNEEMALLGELSQLLHGCGTTSEACALAAQVAARLCPGGSGAIYLLGADSGRAVRAAAWGRVAHVADELRPDACWALRRNAVHAVDPQRLGLLCEHVAHDVLAYACVPLSAPGECLGVLYVERATDASVAAMPGPGILEAVAQEVSLTLANLRLRDMLLRHSVRDPLTGLWNRRVLDEWFERELSRAKRHGSAVGVLLLDVDHFKRLNDAFGHDAGDAMLKALANMLREAVRTEDLVCRYGGEEFLVILGDTSPEHVTLRAADLCERARELTVHDGSHQLPPVTLSVGVAVFPQHGGSAELLLRAADRALYAAKEAGRDRVELAACAATGATTRSAAA